MEMFDKIQFALKNLNKESKQKNLFVLFEDDSGYIENSYGCQFILWHNKEEMISKFISKYYLEHEVEVTFKVKVHHHKNSSQAINAVQNLLPKNAKVICINCVSSQEEPPF